MSSIPFPSPEDPTQAPPPPLDPLYDPTITDGPEIRPPSEPFSPNEELPEVEPPEPVEPPEIELDIVDTDTGGGGDTGTDVADAGSAGDGDDSTS